MLGTVSVCLAMHSNSALSLGVGHFEDLLYVVLAGVNGLTIVFVYLALGIHNKPCLYCLLFVASLVHSGSFLLVRLLNHAVRQANAVTQQTLPLLLHTMPISKHMTFRQAG